MDDLKLLRDLAGNAPVPDDATRARLRAPLEDRMATNGSGTRRHGRRSGLTMILIAAGISVGGVAAAAGLGHLWTANKPVAITMTPVPGGGEEATSIAGGGEPILSLRAFEDTVSEFAPAIRLPEGHSFSPWVTNVENGTDFSDPNSGWQRLQVPTTMVYVAECQWSQQWVDGQTSANQAAVLQSEDVMGRIEEWAKGAGLGSDGYLFGQIRDGHVDAVRQYVGVNCGGDGAVTGTPAELDGIAERDLTTALEVARAFAGSNGGYAGFTEVDGEQAAPHLTWLSYRVTNPADAGMTNIEVAENDRLLLTQESETGTVFCIEDVGGQVTYGQVSAQDVSILHQPGPGSHPEVQCSGSWPSP